MSKLKILIVGGSDSERTILAHLLARRNTGLFKGIEVIDSNPLDESKLDSKIFKAQDITIDTRKNEKDR